MRVETYCLGILLALGAGLAGVGAACGNNVTETTGSSTGSGGEKGTSSSAGTGGVPMTSVVASTTGPSSTSGGMGGMGGMSSSSTGFGGGTSGDCMAECALVKQCFGFDGCAMFGINCAMPNPNATCIIDCIGMAQPTCNNIQGVATGCFQSCMGNMTTSSATGSSSTGGMQSCGSCTSGANGKCNGPVLTCFQDNATHCGSWLSCANGCTTGMMGPSCYAACNSQYPQAAAEYDAIYACSCTSCATECATGDPCSFVGDADGGAADSGAGGGDGG